MIKNCLQCKKEFEVYNCRKDIAKFCSHKCYSLNKIGHVPWNKSKKLSETHRQKLSESHKGQIAWNKGTKGVMKSNKTSFKEGIIPWNNKIKTGIIPKTAFKKGVSVSAKTQFSKGQKAWNEGRKMPEGSKENHPNWKGGITPINRGIRMSLEMKWWRKKVFEKYNYQCIICGQISGWLEADHIYSFAEYPTIRFDINNGQVLCKKCHRQKSRLGDRNLAITL